MDALSEVLGAVRLTGAVFFNGDFTAPWGFEAARVDRLATLLPASTARLLIYHLVIEGSAELRTASAAESLAAGDLVILPHGDPHTFSCGKPPVYLDGTATLLRTFGTTDLNLIRHGGGGATTRFICGYFGCERDAEELFLGGLPPVIKVHLRDDDAGRWLERSICDLLRDARPGQRALLAKMAEALFIEVLRRYMEGLPPGQTGWLAAARDPLVGTALGLIHQNPRHRWSIAELAARAGSSRSVIGERFVRLLGVSPLGYVARWRLHLAAQLLATTRRTITQIADDVGYEADTAFSRAFRRQFGKSPARYRRHVEASGASLGSPGPNSHTDGGHGRAEGPGGITPL